MATIIDDPIWNYYEDKRKEAARLRTEIREVEQEHPRDAQRLKKLRAALDLAEYVGD